MKDSQQKTIKFESTELEIIRYFSEQWSMNYSVVVRRVLREFKQTEDAKLGAKQN